MKKDFICAKDFSAQEISDLLELAGAIKKEPGRYSSELKGKTLALIFEKPSNRTYVSFQVGMYQLGGNSIYLGPEHINLGVRESVPDVAKTLSRYVNIIVLRTFAHDKVVALADASSVPVINGLSDRTHPCQALADVFTLKEKYPGRKNITLAYIGDGNNVCHSLLYCCAKAGINMAVATPPGYEPLKEIADEAAKEAKANSAGIRILHDPAEALKGADAVYTDVWTSMGQEDESAARKKAFKDFQVNEELMKIAPSALIMHCLPAHKGEEITKGVIEGKNSVVFDQAENRLHVQKAIMLALCKRTFKPLPGGPYEK